MKRIVLFLLTNIAVHGGVVDRAEGARPRPGDGSQQGSNLGPLLAFSAVVGFTGAIISLLISKPMAKWSTGAQVIDGSRRHDPALARRDGAPARAAGRHRHARGRDLRGRAERVRNRRVQELGAGRRLDGPAAVDEPGGSRGGARPRGRARRERRHGDDDADPGRGEHLRHLPRRASSARSSTGPCSAASAAPGPATSSP